MGYHSIIYIFLFLPVCLLAYQLAPEKWRGRVLLAFSWIFFYLLSGKLLVYLLGTTLLTHCIGIWLTLLKTEEAKMCIRDRSKLFINSTPFAFPNADSFVGLANYGEGMIKTGFLQAFFITLFITVASVFFIVVLTSMTAWYLVRVKSRFTKVMYYLFAFAMIVPFQMVMFTLVKVSNMFHLDNLIGIIFIYVGFGAGSVSYTHLLRKWRKIN